jgi:hypothetical protein
VIRVAERESPDTTGYDTAVGALAARGIRTLLMVRGKTDTEGQGRLAYLSWETVKWLKIWLEQSEITEGAVFAI